MGKPSLSCSVAALALGDLPLSQHVHRFVPGNRMPRGRKRSKVLFGIGPALYAAMVLLDHIVF
jgi:hypothetical protein